MIQKTLSVHLNLKKMKKILTTKLNLTLLISKHCKRVGFAKPSENKHEEVSSFRV